MDEYLSVEELIINESFIDYCCNANSGHKSKWEKIISEKPAQLKNIEEAKQWILLLGSQLSNDDIENEVNKIRESIAKKENNKLSQIFPEPTFSESLYVNSDGKLRKARVKKMLVWTAAAAMFCVGGWFLLNSYIKPSGDGHFAYSPIYDNVKTNRKQITLPDGSIVILNSNSSIKLSSSYNVSDRTLQLTGDAFFKVKKDPSKPFTVINKMFTATALGTSFYVYADHNNNYSVDLLEGKLKLEPVKKTGSIAYLTAGMKADWSPVQSGFAKNNFDTLSLKKWIQGKISFDKTPLNVGIKELEKWYAVNIELKNNSLGNATITGDYTNAPIEDVLKVICFSLSCRYEHSGNKIIIE